MIVLVPVGQSEKSPILPGRRPTINILFNLKKNCYTAEKKISSQMIVLFCGYINFRTCTLVFRKLNKNSSEISSVSKKEYRCRFH